LDGGWLYKKGRGTGLTEQEECLQDMTSAHTLQLS